MAHETSSNRTSRPTPMRDLRFAGTLAASFCAAVLGIGAVAAPLVGFDEWPSGSPSARDGHLELAMPVAQESPPTARRSSSRSSSPSPSRGGLVSGGGGGL